MTDELKPCPMCSHSTAPKIFPWPEVFADVDPEGHAESYAVFCDASKPGGPGGCGASGGFKPTKAEAVAAWNRRPARPATCASPINPLECPHAQLGCVPLGESDPRTIG